MSFYDAFAASLALVLVGVYLSNRWRDVRFVRSRVDSREYLVRNAEDAQDAADTLARLNRKVGRLIDGLVDKFPDDDRVRRLEERYDPRALSEGSHESGYTSYSVNKGQRIVMCLRSRGGEDSGRLEDLNTLTYVLLHELAHLATDEVGHTPVFWENFRFVVKQAVALRLYEDRDYSESPASYCGMKIDSSSVTKRPPPA